MTDTNRNHSGVAPLLLSAKEAAAICGKSPRTWRSWDAAGWIPRPVRIGRSTLWRADELRDWVRSGCPQPRRVGGTADRGWTTMSRATASRSTISRLVRKSIDSIRPSQQNDRIYRPVDPADPDFRALVRSVRKSGVMEPIVVTSDGVIVSGHRRYTAAVRVGLKTVPCRALRIHSVRDRLAFLQRLRELKDEEP
jgi:predicted DNA-binding transcriptional regulator AlpA